MIQGQHQATGNFDLATSTLSITKSYQRLQGRDVVTPPKTPNSIHFRSWSIWATVLPHTLYDMGGSLGSLLQTSPAAASTPVDAGTSQALAATLQMAFGIVICCVALFLLRESRFSQVQEAWSDAFGAPAAGK